ncbi:uncharacterized protein LOC136764528 [Amia ocellicauda]|uniref:uncharacterized protein LOC136764528 n=1 Tax=Amia ocellicauda TaxID=2972642 RepID=UPI0034643607
MSASAQAFRAQLASVLRGLVPAALGEIAQLSRVQSAQLAAVLDTLVGQLVCEATRLYEAQIHHSRIESQTPKRRTTLAHSEGAGEAGAAGKSRRVGERDCGGSPAAGLRAGTADASLSSDRVSGQDWGSALGVALEEASELRPVRSSKELATVVSVLIKEEPIDSEESRPESLLIKEERCEEDSASSDGPRGLRIGVNRAVEASALLAASERTPVEHQYCEEEWGFSLRQDIEADLQSTHSEEMRAASNGSQQRGLGEDWDGRQWVCRAAPQDVRWILRPCSVKLEKLSSRHRPQELQPWVHSDLRFEMASRRFAPDREVKEMSSALLENSFNTGDTSDPDSQQSWFGEMGRSADECEDIDTKEPQPLIGLPQHKLCCLGESTAGPAGLSVSSPAGTIAGTPILTDIHATGKDGAIQKTSHHNADATGRWATKTHTGPTPSARCQVHSPLSAFHLLIDMQMLRHIQQHTEVEAHKSRSAGSWAVSLGELQAFVAILYVRGAFGCKGGISQENFWSARWGVPFFTETIARNRFREILRFLRFDLRATTSSTCQLPPAGKLVLASEIWEGFLANSAACYTPGETVNANGSLFLTESRSCDCWVRYMAKKTERLGIQFWLVADSETRYVMDGFPYLDSVPGLKTQCLVRAGCCQWPIAVLYNLLHLVATNSLVLYRKCTGKSISRRDFILKLAIELRQQHMEEKGPKLWLAPVGPHVDSSSKMHRRKQCQVAKCRGNKTMESCAQCERFVCGKCTAQLEKRFICVDCDVFTKTQSG